MTFHKLPRARMRDATDRRAQDRSLGHRAKRPVARGRDANSPAVPYRTRQVATPTVWARYGDPPSRNVHSAANTVGPLPHLPTMLNTLALSRAPSSGEKAWDKCLDKLVSKAKAWGRQATGMQFALRISNMYVLPTILCVARLKPLPFPSSY